jgi:hypothetical protein
MARQPLGGLGRLNFRGFAITYFRHTTLGKTPLDEWSARRRDLYLTTHNTHNRQTSMPPAGFEPRIPASERPQTHSSVRVATTGSLLYVNQHGNVTHFAMTTEGSVNPILSQVRSSCLKAIDVSNTLCLTPALKSPIRTILSFLTMSKE